jgi:predicted acetyltransferase
MSQLECGVPRAPDEQAAFVQVANEAFAFPPELSQRYFARVPAQDIRVVRRDGQVLGGLAVLAMGQYFGGRAVPMAGVAVVAVAPEGRARGAATALLRATLNELHAGGTALSALYPATVKLYRRVGYELAGHTCEASLPAKLIDVRERALDVRQATAADEPAIRRLYDDWARPIPGMLARGEFAWARVHDVRGEPTTGYVFTRGGALEGYAFVLTQSAGPYERHLRVQDCAYQTPAAARALLTFCADHRTTRDQVLLRVGPADPLLGLLGEGHYTLTQRGPWMLRIVHVANALTQRGYAPGVQGEVHLAVRDDDVPGNNGRFVLRVADGRAAVTPGGEGRIVAHVRGLAALYSGFFAPESLGLLQLLAGPPDELAAAGALFAGPAPWMRDAF